MWMYFSHIETCGAATALIRESLAAKRIPQKLPKLLPYTTTLLASISGRCTK